jgi:S1-C subfamily serine protease
LLICLIIGCGFTVFAAEGKNLQEQMIEAAKRITPSVVNITAVTRKTVMTRSRHPFYQFFGPLDIKPRVTEATSIGSGVIVAHIEGAAYVITNHHVISGADRIGIRLVDRNTFSAKVVRADKDEDLAILSFETGAYPVVAAELGKPGDLQVGQWVLAVGNPFGLSHTVTQGIVSAVDRVLPEESKYRDYIQTSAAINHGNSGGPLINLEGKVVGINTAVVNPEQGAFAGIGLAVPISMSRLKSLISTGSVARSDLGVYGRTATRDEFQTGGFVIEEVRSDTARKGDLRVGDIIISYNSKVVSGLQDLKQRLATTEPGETVSLRVKRGSVILGVQVKTEAGKGRLAANWLGLTVRVLDAKAKRQLGYTARSRGMLVLAVSSDGPAARTPLRAGDVIMQVGREPVSSMDDWKTALEGYADQGTVPLMAYLTRYGRVGVVKIQVGNR